MAYGSPVISTYERFWGRVGLVDSFRKGQSHEQLTINSKHIRCNVA